MPRKAPVPARPAPAHKQTAQPDPIPTPLTDAQVRGCIERLLTHHIPLELPPQVLRSGCPTIEFGPKDAQGNIRAVPLWCCENGTAVLDRPGECLFVAEAGRGPVMLELVIMADWAIRLPGYPTNHVCRVIEPPAYGVVTKSLVAYHIAKAYRDYYTKMVELECETRRLYKFPFCGEADWILGYKINFYQMKLADLRRYEDNTWHASIVIGSVTQP